jgi:hypothetical protein
MLRTFPGIRGWEVLQQIPYFPDISLCNYNIIPKLKQSLHGKWYTNKENILIAVWHNVAQISTSDANSVSCQPYHW